MGRQKYLAEIEKLFRKSPVVDRKSIELIVEHKKNNQYVKQLIKRLVDKGKIKRISKGFYTIYNEPSLAVFYFKPAYLGLQDALSFHELWEQETIAVILTARRIRQGIRKINDSNVLVRRIDKKYFFGFEYYKNGNFHFPYSDIEKTFIDMVYFKQKLSEEALNNIRKRIDVGKLKKYLRFYPMKFKKRVMEYIGS